MNTDLVTPSTQKTSGQPVGLPSDVPQSKIKVAGPAWSQNSKIPTPVHRKIAKLPKPLRDLINSSLDDGLSARQIIEKLQASTNPPLPYPISAMNISDWRKTGHQRYLRQEEWRDQLRILRENGSDMSELADGPKFQETLIQIALTEIFRVLQEGELKPDSLNYIRLFNALARLNREALSLRKYNDQLAKEEVALKQLDPNRKLTDNEHRAIADIIDQVMEMPRPRPLWSAPAERSGDGALGDSARTAPSADPVPAASFAEVGRGVLTAPPAFPNEPAASNCPPSPSNPSSPLPSRPCRAEPPDPCSRREEAEAQTCDQQSAHDPPATESHATDCSLLTNDSSAIQNPQSKIQNFPRPSEHCLDCRSPLPPVAPCALRRPEDHCPSCGMRLPDIGLCYQPGFDHCLNCDATQPALLPGGERPRPHCHKCGQRLHNPENIQPLSASNSKPQTED